MNYEYFQILQIFKQNKPFEILAFQMDNNNEYNDRDKDSDQQGLVQAIKVFVGRELKKIEKQ